MPEFIPLPYTSLSEEEQFRRAREFYELCAVRRTVREFSDRPVSREMLMYLLKTAGTAPSGANRQPWRFVIVTDWETKRKIRLAAEKEEKESYEERMPDQWLKDLEALGTDWHKEFLEIAPALIVVFGVNYDLEGGTVHKNYYVKESVGIAVGFLLAAIHQAGLVSLTHTPSPMNFLQEILGRPENERPFLLLPVGYPALDARVPAIGRKKPEEFILWYRSP
ncbi:MAG: nitroreductase family protein [Ignavibacteriales bacterium]|nr:nitroreductase family protein [Ignavibacteriales bacterium]